MTHTTEGNTVQRWEKDLLSHCEPLYPSCLPLHHNSSEPLLVITIFLGADKRLSTVANIIFQIKSTNDVIMLLHSAALQQGKWFCILPGGLRKYSEKRSLNCSALKTYRRKEFLKHNFLTKNIKLSQTTFFSCLSLCHKCHSVTTKRHVVPILCAFYLHSICAHQSFSGIFIPQPWKPTSGYFSEIWTSHIIEFQLHGFQSFYLKEMCSLL